MIQTQLILSSVRVVVNIAISGWIQVALAENGTGVQSLTRKSRDMEYDNTKYLVIKVISE